MAASCSIIGRAKRRTIASDHVHPFCSEYRDHCFCENPRVSICALMTPTPGCSCPLSTKNVREGFLHLLAIVVGSAVRGGALIPGPNWRLSTSMHSALTFSRRSVKRPLEHAPGSISREARGSFRLADWQTRPRFVSQLLKHYHPVRVCARQVVGGSPSIVRGIT